MLTLLMHGRVKEGLIYVGMSRDDLQPYINSSSQHYSTLDPSRSPPPHRYPESHRLTLLESLHDPEVARAMNIRRGAGFFSSDSPGDDQSQDNDADDVWSSFPTTRDVSRPPNDSRRRQSAREDADSRNCDEPTDSRDASDNHVVMLSDEEIAWPEDPTREDVLDDRRRRERNLRDYDDEDIWDARFRTNYARFRTRQAQSTMRRTEAPPLSPEPDQHRPDAVAKARFHIKDNRHRVAIKFDPPVYVAMP